MCLRQNIKGMITGWGLTIGLIFAGISTTALAADGPSFLVFGDAPYTARQISRLTQTVAPAIRNAPFPFLIHVGDMKGGGEPCTDELIKARYEQLMHLHSKGRVFYTPGDNEWTDCDRSSLKTPVSELHRLDALRSLILSNPLQLPAGWHHTTQRGFPENARWTHDNVMFATVHIVSTNNGREEILLDDIETTLDLVDARDRANLDWLKDAFDMASKSNSDAVVIATQADVTKIAGSARCDDAVRVECDAFAAFRDNLLRRAASFKKPVLLIHGDTNPFCLDKKFGGDTAPLLWRLNALGDYSVLDATVISHQPDNQDEPFSVTSLITKTPVGRTC
ncbi:MAG: hypothetical protein GY869_23260 [Planctomycetes bacterium]|nr:hypothetical protein [Planctomycetota bacterium]